MGIELDPKDADFYGDIQRLAEKLGQIARRKDISRYELVQSLQAATEKFVRFYGEQSSGMVDAQTLANELQEQFFQIFRNERPDKDTGIAPLDHTLNGLGPGKMYLLAARPGHGKTSLVVSIKRWRLDQGDCVYMASAEESRLMVGSRLTSHYAMMPVARQKPGMSEVDLRSLNDAAAILAGKKFFINDRARLTVEAIERNLNELEDNKNPAEIVFIDYVQLLRSEILDPRTSEFERLSYISSEVLSIAKRHNVPVVCAAQENRESDKRAGADAKLSDIRGTGQLEQDAHFVAHIRNERPSNSDSDRAIRSNQDGKAYIWKAQLKVTKNRSGATGDVDLVYHAPLMQFTAFEEYNQYGLF